MRKKRKIPRKKKKIALSVFISSILGSLYFITALDMLLNLKMALLTKRSFLPHDVLAFDIINHPFAVILAIVFSIFMMRLLTNRIADKMSKRYGDIKVSKEKINGVNERMGDDEKERLFEYRDYYDPEGIIVAVDKDTGDLLTIPWEYDDPEEALTNNNIIVFGDTGSRKTSGFLEGNILSCIKRGCTICLTDPKGEEYAATAPAAIAYGYKVHILDFVGGHFQHSDGWDVLKLVRESDSPEEVSQIIVDQIVKNIGTSEDNFWNDMNTNLLKLLIMTVSVAEGYIPRTSANNKARGRTFREVFALLGDEDLEITLGNLMISEHNRKYLKDKFLTWSTHPQKEGIRAGLQSKLAILNSENLLSVLSEDDVDFKKMNEEKSITYIIASDKDSTYKSVLALVSAMMFREIMEYADEQGTKSLSRPFYMFFEEFKNVGYIPDLAIKMAVVRSRHINIIFCFQNIGQIKDQYGSKKDGKFEWQTILSACALQVCCGANDIDTAKYFSDRSGDMSVIEKSSAQNVSSLAPDTLKWSPRERQLENRSTRKVYLPSEIYSMKKSEILISPSKHNSTIENKYYSKNHPLAQYKAVDDSGNIINLSPDDYIPAWRERMIRNDAINASGTDTSVVIPKVNIKKFDGIHKNLDNGKDREDALISRIAEIKELIFEPECEKRRGKPIRYEDFTRPEEKTRESPVQQEDIKKNPANEDAGEKNYYHYEEYDEEMF